MYIPKSLVKGDSIGLVYTARKIERQLIDPVIEVIEKEGFEVVVGESVGAEHHQYAGDDSLRVRDLQRMMDNPDIKAVIVCRGGYGTVRIIDKIVYNSF